MQDDGWERLAWPVLAERSWRVAGGLIDGGVRRGEVVAIIGGTSPAVVAGFFGAMLAGAIPSLCPPPDRLGERERYETHLIRMLQALDAGCVLAAPGLEPAARSLAGRAGVRTLALTELHDAAPATAPRRPAELALVQFTSGSSDHPRPIPVSFSALDANVDAIRRWLGMGSDDRVASWLPLHHDRGLIGCLITPTAASCELQLMTPAQFVRSPLRYLRCFDNARARLSAMPGFGLEQVLRRVRPEMLGDLALHGWRTLIVSAERLAPDLLRRFEALLSPAGFSERTLRPAYGLAEATLAVTGLGRQQRWREVVIPAGVTPGETVVAPAHGVRERAARQHVVGCGRPLAGVAVRIADDAGAPLPDGRLGEILIDGPWSTRTLAAGDEGFVDGGELFVLGRLGDGLKISGRFVFAEGTESDIVAAGLSPGRTAVILGHDGDDATAVAVLECAGDTEVSQAYAVLRRRTDGVRSTVIVVGRGAIPRTTSGKPRAARPLERLHHTATATTHPPARPPALQDGSSSGATPCMRVPSPSGPSRT